MPLETRILHIPLVGGMQQKADEVSLEPPAMTLVTNKAFTKKGALDTRPCMTTATTSAHGLSLTTPRALIGTSEEIVAVDNKNCAYAYDVDSAEWSRRGRMPVWQARTVPLLRSVFENIARPQMLYHAGQLWMFYKRHARWYYVRVNPATGSAISIEAQLFGSTIAVGDIRVVIAGAVLVVVWDRTSTTQIMMSTLSLSAPTAIVGGAVLTTYAWGPYFDAYAIGANVAVGVSTDGALVGAGIFTSAGANIDSFDVAAVHAREISVAASSTSLFLAYTSAKTACLARYDLGTSAISANTTIYDFTASGQGCAGSALEMVGADTVLALVTKSWLGQTTSTWGTFAAIWEDNSGTMVPSLGSNDARMTPQVCVDSRPFLYDSRWYAWMRCDALAVGTDTFIAIGDKVQGMDSGYGLFDITEQVVNENPFASEASFMATVQAWTSPRRLTLPAWNNISNTTNGIGTAYGIATDGMGKFWSACAVRTAPAGYDPIEVAAGRAPEATGVDLVEVDALAQYRAVAANVETLSCVNGGTPWAYSNVAQQPDVAIVVGGPNEWNFFNKPDGAFAAAQAGAAHFLDVGTYRYFALYEWEDDSGHKVRSDAVDMGEVVVAAPATKKATLLIPHLKITNKQSKYAGNRPVAIVVYRAEASGDNIPRRLTPTPCGATWENDVGLTAPYMTFEDTAPLKSFDANEILYTTGGVLADQQPPPFSTVVTHGGRLFGASGSRVYFSKTYAFDSVPGFNDSSVISIGDGGDITGLASLDQNLAIFKQSGLYVLSGFGPADTGAGYDFQTQKAATPIGCIEPRSVATTSEGVVFQAREGLFMLNRSMQVEYIGAGVEDDLARWPRITSAVYVPDAYQVRFTCCVGPGSEFPSAPGVVLVYDLTFQQWARWYIRDGVQSELVAVNGLVAALAPLWSDTTADILLEDGATTDDAAGVSSSFTTAWVKTGGIEGFQRVRRVQFLGRWVSDVDLALTFECDYRTDGLYRERRTLPANVVKSFTNDGRVQFDVHLAHQKCEALRISVAETGCAPSGQPTTSFKLQTLADASNFTVGGGVSFIAGTALGSAAAHDGSTYTAEVTDVDPVTGFITLDVDVSTWAVPPSTGWTVVPLQWSDLHVSQTTWVTTLVPTGGALMGVTSGATYAGRGITWESVGIEVATMPMRYKRLAPAAKV